MSLEDNQHPMIISFGIILIVMAGIAALVFLLSDGKETSASPPAPSPAEIIQTQADPLSNPQNKPEIKINPNTMPIVKIQTNLGDITVELFSADAPKAAENFIALAKKGFYNGVIFHRVIKGFMIQGGDPTGTGSGGPSYQFADELNPQTPSYQRGYMRGVLAMANAGPDTNGSQFFILHQDYPLPHNYTIFGQVISGLETVDAIANLPVDGDDRPRQEAVMTKVEVVE